MFWCEQILKKITTPQVINDSKTPSGRVHVGSLRGVLIHDAIFRVLQEKNIPVRYLFGVDDYDPLDEIPSGEKEHFAAFLGAPLCNVPPPPGSAAKDMAEHYITEFFDVFAQLGVKTETYRMRDLYRSGKFNTVIDQILRQSDVVRQIYRDVSSSERSSDWFPFQVICEQCGKIGTTQVTAYDGKKVEYRCQPNLVSWAKGCSHRGKISPFDGNGKLPWKLEWVGKWNVLGITIEGAGKDHTTKGGSRDVANRCMQRIFRRQAPLNIPYEFFLVGGAKMSSSRGIGVSAKEMADFLPLDILRFLLLRTPPKRPVNFSPEEKNVIKLFNDADRLHHRVINGMAIPEESLLYHLCSFSAESDYTANLQLVITLVQMPHLDVESEIQRHKGSPLSPAETKHLHQRIQAARCWLTYFASEAEKIELQSDLPDNAKQLSNVQWGFLHRLSAELEKITWEHEKIQSAIFQAARTTPIPQKLAFEAIYRVFLDRVSGPKAGNLLYFLGPSLVHDRCRELPFSNLELWRETSMTLSDAEKWLEKEAEHIVSGTIKYHTDLGDNEERKNIIPSQEKNLLLEWHLKMADNKEYVKRVLLPGTESKNTSSAETTITEILRRFSVEQKMRVIASKMGRNPNHI